MAENVSFLSTRPTKSREVSKLLTNFLEDKRKYGLDLSSLANVHRHSSSKSRAKLSDEKDMVLSLLLAGLNEDDDHEVNSTGSRDKDQKKSGKKRKSKDESDGKEVLVEEKTPKKARKHEAEVETEAIPKKKDKSKKVTVVSEAHNGSSNGEITPKKKKSKKRVEVQENVDDTVVDEGEEGNDTIHGHAKDHASKKRHRHLEAEETSHKKKKRRNDD